MGAHLSIEGYLRETLPAQLEEWQQPGLAVAVVRSGQPDVVAGYGRRRPGDAGEVGPDTRFALASCSKPFAALSAALLVDQGRMGFDDRVRDILPWFRLSSAAVTEQLTVRDLLCNRLGITSSEGRHRQAASNRRDLLERLRYHRFRHAFRAQFGYCTDAFTLLGEVVATVAGMPWEVWVRQRLWQPLGMLRTNASSREASADPDHAAPHRFVSAGFEAIPWVYEDHIATPAGGVNSTAGDMARWLHFLLGAERSMEGSCQGRPLLSRRSLEALWTPHTPEAGAFADHELARVVGDGPRGIVEPGYALGWYCHHYLGRRVLYHCGAIPGFRATVGHLPDDGLGIAVLANSDSDCLPKMVFQTLVDRALDAPRENWHKRFFHRQREERRSAAREVGATPEAGSGTAIPLQAGFYRDDTGFGDAELVREGGTLVLYAGELVFDIASDEAGNYQATKRWPYRCSPQFSLATRTDRSGRYLGFDTSQGACFRFLGERVGPVAAGSPGL